MNGCHAQNNLTAYLPGKLEEITCTSTDYMSDELTTDLDVNVNVNHPFI